MFSAPAMLIRTTTRQSCATPDQDISKIKMITVQLFHLLMVLNDSVDRSLKIKLRPP